MKKVIACILSALIFCSVSVQAYDVECYDTTKRSIGEAADASGMSYEEYQDYMLINKDIPSWETERAAELKSYAMPVVNALGLTVDDFKAMFGLTIDVNDTTTMCEVYDNMPLEIYWGTDYAEMVEYYGLGESVTPETLYGTIRLETEKKDMDAVERKTFSDVGYAHWAYYYITEMMESEIIDGYDDGTYLPEKSVTRAEFAKMLAMMTYSVSDGENKYSDVSDDMWYYEYVNSVSDYFDSENGEFRPEEVATREVVATAIAKALGFSGDASAQVLQEKFTDADTVSEKNAPYVATMVEKGIIDGFDDGTIGANATLTRAQAATILYRAFYEYVNIPAEYGLVVAEVGDMAITLGDALYTVGVDSSVDINDPKVLTEQLNRAVKTTIDMYRCIEFAKDKGITVTDADKREGLAYRTQFATGIGYRKYSEYLKANGTSMDYLDKYIEVLVYTQKLLDIYTEEELDKELEKYKPVIYKDKIDALTLEQLTM